MFPGQAILLSSVVEILTLPMTELEHRGNFLATMFIVLAAGCLVAVAHRLSTIKDADVICVFDQGRIVEMGSHSDLIGTGTMYSKMCEAQALDPWTRSRPGGKCEVYDFHFNVPSS